MPDKPPDPVRPIKETLADLITTLSEKGVLNDHERQQLLNELTERESE
jgi:hypothetical protein